jgi:hypothetical protein
MNTEQQRVRFINATMDLLHNLCDDLYEALMDEDFSSVERIAKEIREIMIDLQETFQNEI